MGSSGLAPLAGMTGGPLAKRPARRHKAPITQHGAAMTTHTLLLLPGDGIGPEVMREVGKVVGWFGRRGVAFETETDLVGGAAYDAHGVAITDAAMARAQAADAVLFGAVGGPKWADVPYDARPEAGLLRLRKDLGLFANLRPAICYPALADASSLKREVVEGLDIVIVRELTGGVYFGEPKEIVVLEDGSTRAVDTQVYTEGEIERIARVAFDLARKRRGKVSSAEKHNVMKTGVLWKQVVARVGADEFPDIELEHVLADNCAMQLVRWPKQYDVIVTDNLFGDVLSDIAATLTGSLGMLPSASLGAEDRGDGQAQGALRAGARLGARHRRAGPGEPDRDDRLASPWRCATPSGSATRPISWRAPITGALAAGRAHQGHRGARARTRSARPRWATRSSPSSTGCRPSAARRARTKSIGPNGLRAPTKGPLVIGSGRRSWP